MPDAPELNPTEITPNSKKESIGEVKIFQNNTSITIGTRKP